MAVKRKISLLYFQYHPLKIIYSISKTITPSNLQTKTYPIPYINNIIKM